MLPDHQIFVTELFFGGKNEVFVTNFEVSVTKCMPHVTVEGLILTTVCSRLL
jgi:hypothetical protein